MSEPDSAPARATSAAIEKAIRFNQIGRHDAAARAAREGLARDPRSAPLHVQLAHAHLLAGELREAESAARDAVQYAPEWAIPYSILGSILARAGKHSRSEEAFLTALRLAPEEPSTYSAYAALLYKTGHVAKAEALARRAIALDPEDAGHHALLSHIHAERDRRAEARAAGETALRLAPGEDGGHAALGLACLRSGHPFRARRHLREALRLDPSDTEVEEAWLEADRCCRFVYLPMYYWSLFLHRLPGRQFAVWGAFVALTLVAPRLGVPPAAVGTIAIAYVLFCVYTWCSRPLVGLWVRMVPPR